LGWTEKKGGKWYVAGKTKSPTTVPEGAFNEDGVVVIAVVPEDNDDIGPVVELAIIFVDAVVVVADTGDRGGEEVAIAVEIEVAVVVLVLIEDI
jgi:hypothetical protein